MNGNNTRSVVVFSAPAIMTHQNDDFFLESDELEMVTLSCTARGVPKPTFTWSPANGDITEAAWTDRDGFFQVISNLTIASIVRTDAGIYTCIVNNTGSLQTRNFTLKVNCKF